MTHNEYSLSDSAAYLSWRAEKLSHYPINLDTLVTTVDDPTQLSLSEKAALISNSNNLNFALYRCNRVMGKPDVLALGQQLGLVNISSNICADENGVSSVKVVPHADSPKYIPYTDRLLNWHTDGYYHPQEDPIRSFILHCVSAAKLGGENKILDHEMAYLLLRDENPAFVKALAHGGAMTIPANNKDNRNIREAITGPVFSLFNENFLHMRFTARTRSIKWREDKMLTEARMCLSDIINNSEYVFTHTLEPNQGLVCNNVLHARTEFSDSNQQQRLIYRARFSDQITTGI